MRAPSEHASIEGLRFVDVARVELDPRGAPRDVFHLNALVFGRLPHTDHRARRVRDDGHLPLAHDVHGLHQHVAARLPRLGHCPGRVAHVDVAGPRCRLVLALDRPHAAYHLAVQVEEAVSAGLRIWDDVRGPTEQFRIEGP